MTSFTEWIQPDDIYVTASKTTTRRGWERGLGWRGTTAGTFSYYEDAYDFLRGPDPIVYPDILSWLPDYSSGDDAIDTSAHSFHRGLWGTPDEYYTYTAGINSSLAWFNIACTLPAGNPANPTPSEIPDGATLEWENPTGAYTGEIRYQFTAWASDELGASGVGNGSGRVMIKPETGPGAEWPGVAAMSGAGWTTSAVISDETTLEFLLPSLNACITGMPSQMLDGTPLPSTADTLSHEILWVGVTPAATGVTPSFATHARYVPPRYRFVYDTPTVAGGGLWTTRQRQTATGNTGGWPLRQRNNGGATGAWSLRQRQTGN